MKKTIFVKGMHCKSCEMMIEGEVKEVAGVNAVTANHKKGTVEISYEKTEPSREAIGEAVKKAGYAVGVAARPWFSREPDDYMEALFVFVALVIVYLFARSAGFSSISFGSFGGGFSSLPVVFLVGITAGLSSCMAMIGGLLLGVSARYSELHPGATVRQRFVPHLFFNGSRVASFALFGGLLGTFGSFFQPSATALGGLTLVVGVVMLVLGLQLVGLFPRISTWNFTLPKRVGYFFGVREGAGKRYSHRQAITLGAVTFFMPCGFTQAVQLYVVSQGSFVTGALVMTTFALGTAPGMLGVGGLASAVTGTFRRYFFRFAGMAVIGLAIFNFGNGWNLMELSSGKTMTEDRVAVGTPAPAKTPTAVVNTEPQVINMTQNADGYAPNTFTVKRGQPVKWVIDSKDSYSCAVSLIAPQIGVKKSLQAGENVVAFTPQAAGDIPFSCSMGMYRGVIHVTE